MPTFVIIGGGILGTAVAYLLSTRFDGRQILVIEQEADVGRHMSGRNTGVIHRPFYLDPAHKRIFARMANLSYPLWSAYAAARSLPWKKVGTLEVALDATDRQVLETYARWAAENGIPEGEVRLLSGREAKKLEPEIACESALLSVTDTAVDFGRFTKALRHDAEAGGVSFVLGVAVSSIGTKGPDLEMRLADGSTRAARFVLNCAGGGALRIARALGVADNLAAVNFRGEYFRIAPEHARLASRNVYSVPRRREMPFLDPHWVVRFDGTVEIGPTAVPVIGPYTYEGLIPPFSRLLGDTSELAHPNVMRLFGNAEFWQLAGTEWKSSMSPGALVKRVARFLPALTARHLAGKGRSGVRSAVIGADGSFVKEVVEREGPQSLHILNYNSPGATGAPAYAVHLIERALSLGAAHFLSPRSAPSGTVWNYQDIASHLV
ncbi:MAG: FAD-dependent oxidoreductase [Patescibacteria group bacterium]